MQSRPWIAIVLLVSAGLAAQTAAADPQADVAAAGQKWGTVFAENNPDTMMPLYAKDGGAFPDPIVNTTWDYKKP